MHTLVADKYCPARHRVASPDPAGGGGEGGGDPGGERTGGGDGGGGGEGGGTTLDVVLLHEVDPGREFALYVPHGEHCVAPEVEE